MVQEILYSVWMTIADLWDSIMEKRIDLQQLKLKLKLYSVLNNQVMPSYSNHDYADNEAACFDSFKFLRCLFSHLIFPAYYVV